MIKEAITFDNRLKKVGLAIDIKKLIKDDDQDPRKKDIINSESDSDDDLMNKNENKGFSDIDDSDEEVDYTNLGKVDIN